VNLFAALPRNPPEGVMGKPLSIDEAAVATEQD